MGNLTPTLSTPLVKNINASKSRLRTEKKKMQESDNNQRLTFLNVKISSIFLSLISTVFHLFNYLVIIMAPF